MLSSSPLIGMASERMLPELKDDIFEGDVRRLREDERGASWSPAAGSAPTLMYVGARSGLEAHIAQARLAAATIVIIEPDPARRGAVARSLGRYGEVVCLDPADTRAIERLLPRVSFVRVNAERFPEIWAWLEGADLEWLCGTFRSADIDPLAVYRRACRVARRFHLRDLANGRRLVTGAMRTRPVEVSVVVPVYDVAGQLEQCLSSLVRQTIESVEIVVVDDGSRDATAAIATEFATRFPGRLRLIHQANGGCAAARSTGLREARGEFVGFVDGDDWVEPTMFETLFRAACLHDVEIAQCGYREVYADGSVVTPPSEGDLRLLCGEQRVVTRAIELAATRPTIWRRLYRREFLSRHKISFPVHIRSFDDTAFQFETFARAARIVLLPEIGYNYRQGRAGQDIAARDERLFAFFEVFEWLDAKMVAIAGPCSDRQMLRVELNCHVWALERIEPGIRDAYRHRALRQLARRRAHLGPLGSIGVAAKMYSKARTLMLSAILSHFLPWLPRSTMASRP